MRFVEGANEGSGFAFAVRMHGNFTIQCPGERFFVSVQIPI
jgi:hypothetical protein